LFGGPWNRRATELGMQKHIAPKGKGREKNKGRFWEKGGTEASISTKGNEKWGWKNQEKQP